MPQASVAIQILPKVRNDQKALRIIDSVIAYIKEQHLSCEVGPMETIIEGDLERLLEIIKDIQYLSVKKGAASVFSNIKIIYSPKGVMTIRQKVRKHR